MSLPPPPTPKRQTAPIVTVACRVQRRPASRIDATARHCPAALFHALAGLTLLTGCTLQPGYQRPALSLPVSWDNGSLADAASSAEAPTGRGAWWTGLHDTALDTLVADALASNPTLAEAAARVDQARAALASDRAQAIPRADLEADAARAQSGTTSLAGTRVVRSSSATAGPRLSWEVDLWGRLRETARASDNRLAARTADAKDARLSIAAQVADGVLLLKACTYSLGVRDSEIASRTVELAVTRKRLAFGNIAPVDVANAEGNLAAARTDRIALREQCLHDTDGLVALTGRRSGDIETLLFVRGGVSTDSNGGAPIVATTMSAPPPFVPALPACVLLAHPSVVASEREAAARWSEIGVARAERLPRLDLAAVLSGNWLGALGSSTTFASWSAGPSLSGALFDGGAGSAKVRLAQARYREAVATLEVTLRSAAQDIEDALAAQQSATLREETSRQSVSAARFTLEANEARWRAGAISLFELEDSRRLLRTAQDSAIAAARDRARAWVELVRRSGSAFDGDDPRATACGTPAIRRAASLE
ncbi:efflux transporter outer membrane subunit [uncultured Sphingomonas sp.]|uniref:efflux transporter outer membrane subunit n=1 Tax=uncultured Sphingomonas sp. TaxID=158754 RepID=UPI0035CC9C68